MIKKILFLFLITLNGKIYSQVNFGFENWTFKGNCFDADGWFTSNLFVSLGSNVSCVKGKPYVGKYSIGICPFKTNNFDTMSGFASQQFKYTNKVNSINLNYLYNCSINDSASITVLFYNGYSQDTNNIIGRSTIYLTKNKDWTNIRRNIIWKNNLMPDSASVTISNNPRNKKDTIFVDDISFSNGSNFGNLFISNRLFIYPSPVDCVLNIDIPIEGLDNIINATILDIHGKTVGSSISKEHNNKLSIETSDLSNGIYIIYLQGNNKSYKSVIYIQH